MRARAPGCLALALWASATLFAGPGLADYQSDFRDGFRAFEDKDWATAVRLMKSAIRQQPQAARTNIEISGTFTEVYTPYLWLGLASAELGQCDDVLLALEQATSYGIAERRNKRHFARLQEAAGACGRPDLSALVGTVTARLEDARQSSRAWRDLNGQPGMSERLNPDLRTRASSATAALARAESELEAAQQSGSQAALERVEQQAIQVASDFNDLTRLLRATPPPVRTAANDRPPDRPPSTPPDRQDIEDDPSKLRNLGSDRSAANDRERPTDSTERPDPVDIEPTTFPADRDGGREDTTSETETPEPPTTEPPPREDDRPGVDTRPGRSEPTAVPVIEGLRLVSAAYLASEYEQALATAQRLQPNDPRERLVTDLLTAASSFQLFRAGGEEDPSLLELARQAVAQVKLAEPGYRPDSAWFSPDFVALFSSGG